MECLSPAVRKQPVCCDSLTPVNTHERQTDDRVSLTGHLQEGFSRLSVKDQLLHCVGTSHQQRYESDDVPSSRVWSDDELSIMCALCFMLRESSDFGSRGGNLHTKPQQF